MGKPCPKIYHAAHLLFTNPNMQIDDAMKLAKYSNRELNVRSIRKAISKKKNRLKDAALRLNEATNPTVADVTFSTNATSTNVSSLTANSWSDSGNKKRKSASTSTASSAQSKKQKKNLRHRTARGEHLAKCTLLGDQGELQAKL